jgi:glutarate dioxygenase
MTVVKQSFKVAVNPQHNRIKNIEFNPELVSEFLEDLEDISSQQLENVAFMRFHVAKKFREIFGEDIVQALKNILHDRSTGGFTIGLDNYLTDFASFLKISTAVAYSIGISNFDDMSGEYYAVFDVKHSYDSDTNLRKAYRNLELHTDGVFVNEVTDWLLMMKIKEEHAEGGESRFLHIDDWEDLNKYLKHSLSSHKFKYTYAHRKSKNITDVVYDPIFYKKDNQVCMRYNDQCTFPETEEQAEYLKEISESIEKSPGTKSVELPVGHFVVLNNHFWLHGREPFKENKQLFRQLMRQRGIFNKNV